MELYSSEIRSTSKHGWIRHYLEHRTTACIVKSGLVLTTGAVISTKCYYVYRNSKHRSLAFLSDWKKNCLVGIKIIMTIALLQNKLLTIILWQAFLAVLTSYSGMQLFSSLDLPCQIYFYVQCHVFCIWLWTQVPLSLLFILDK